MRSARLTSPKRRVKGILAVLSMVTLLMPWSPPSVQAGPGAVSQSESGTGRIPSAGGAIAAGAQERSLGSDVVPWAPPQPGYRIRVRQEGIYRLTYADLASAGIPVSDLGPLGPSGLQLFHNGEEVAIWVAGEDDGTFDLDDHVLFHGEALESKYTWYSVYWLTYGLAAGKRMAVRDGTPSGVPLAAYHMDLLHFESNLFYASFVPGTEDLDRFLWGYAAPGVPDFTHTFSLSAPDASAGGELQVSLFGSTSTPWPRARVYLNNQLLDDAIWQGGTWRISTSSIPAGLLVAGSNTLRVNCPNSGDLVYIDWAEVAFANAFVASGDVLAFAYGTPGLSQYQIDGFGVSDVAVFDVTDPAAVERIGGASVEPSGGGFSATFEDDVAGMTEYWVGSAGSYLEAEAIEADKTSNLGSTQNGADYILITHADFAQSIQPLAAYRAAQNMRVLQVDVQDVYDEFGHGVVGAHPIHDFLDYAYHNWQLPRPKYVLLVGDGHYDPKNYLGYGRTSYMPPYLARVDPWIGETSADNRYVTVTGDDAFPDMIIGRLPVNSPAEAAIVVAKTLQYEQNPAPGDWKTKMLFAADNKDAGGDFAAISDALIACCLPPIFQASKAYYLVTHQTPAATKQAIIAAVNEGRLLVNYIGHGATSTWAAEYLFRTTDIGSLTNSTMSTIFLTMTCKDGYYIEPMVGAGNSMAESLLRADGKGAVAVWSPSGMGVSTGHDYLDRGFFDALFVGGADTVGEATLAGKQRLWDAHYALDLLDTYHLFGDPALRIPVSPTGVTLALLDVVLGGDSALVVQWETVSEIDNLGFSVYRSEPENAPRVKLNASLIPSQVPPGSPMGAFYEFIDDTVVPGVQYSYWLEDVDVYGAAALHGPVRAMLGRLLVPMVLR